MAEARIIKRYANRKLYDTQHSRYVTLDQISEMIRAGDEVKIIDNKSKEDLTSVTLAQILFEEEKKQPSFMPLSAMRTMIQNGGDFFAEVQRKVQAIIPKRTGEEAAEDDKRPLVVLRQWVAQSRTMLDEYQKKMDERIRTAVEGISPFSGLHKDVQALSDRIAELEAKLSQMDDDGK